MKAIGMILLTIFLGKSCSNEAQNDINNAVLQYSAHTRGFHLKIIITKMKVKNWVFASLIGMMLMSSCSENISNKGDALFSQKQYEDAVAEYDKVLKNNPKYFKGLYNRGRAYEELGEFKKAEKDFMEVQEEFEQHRKNALERERKLKRELIDAQMGKNS